MKLWGLCGAFLAAASSAWGFTNLSAEQLHVRLASGDTLLVLDVREMDEYAEGHIAEPAGLLPFTPANMPWRSNVLSSYYTRLPKNIDIVVHCRSGGRSATASAFLESKDFKRIYNLAGGYLSWTYERKNNGFGDHSGDWVRTSALEPVMIYSPDPDDSSKITFSSNSLAGAGSAYFELHRVPSALDIFPDTPRSKVDGLFRVTALDGFGLSMFDADSLVLADTASITLFPQAKNDEGPLTQPLNNAQLSVYVPQEGWRYISFESDSISVTREEHILRRWYRVTGSVSRVLAARPRVEKRELHVYPNPFNSSLTIEAPDNATISVYNINGRLIETLTSHRWIPQGTVGGGVYFIYIQSTRDRYIEKVLYLK